MGEYPRGTFRFKKLCGSLWKGETLRFADYTTVVPKAFTERGLYMLATILKGPRATATTFAIIESFFKLRTLVRNVNIMATEYDEEKRKSLVQRSGELLNELLTDEGDITETESSIELNLYALKMKRTVKRTKKG